MPTEQPTVLVYRTNHCPYCVAAVRLLEKRGYPYREINLDGKPDDRAALEARTNWRTVPQIFVGERFIGGYTDMAALDASGELARLMGAA